jgi:hypothetical protein
MEKKGFTGKLSYDFDPSQHLEVFMPKLNDWFRVTAKEFRSFNGNRRINNVEYNGPVYAHGTNNKLDTSKYSIGEICEYNFISKKRPFDHL